MHAHGIPLATGSTNVPTFVDTNVLVYSRDASEKRKQQRAHDWLTHLWVAHEGRVSFQVLEEYYTTVTRKLRPGLPREDARSDVSGLLAWRPVVIDELILMAAWDIEDATSLSVWDALIVSAAQAAGCQVLLTEDLQDGRTFGDVTVVNPFAHEPDSFA